MKLQKNSKDGRRYGGSSTYGLYDLVIRIEAKTLGHLDRIITDIRRTEEIEQTSTLVGI